MKQSYFIVAESVHMFPEAKLVIVGTFDVISAKAMPIVFRPFGIAVRLEAGKSERGRRYKGVLTLRKSRSQKSMFSLPWEFSFPKGAAAMPASAILALGLPPLEFKSAGAYVFEVKTGHRCVARSMLYVREVKGNGSAAAPRTKRRGKSSSRRK